MTRDIVWTPSWYDPTPSSDDMWFQESINPTPLHRDFDFFGEHIESNLTEALSQSLLLLLRRTGPALGNFYALENLHGEQVLFLQEEHVSANLGEITPASSDHTDHNTTMLSYIAICAPKYTASLGMNFCFMFH